MLAVKGWGGGEVVRQFPICEFGGALAVRDDAGGFRCGLGGEREREVDGAMLCIHACDADGGLSGTKRGVAWCARGGFDDNGFSSVSSRRRCHGMMEQSGYGTGGGNQRELWCVMMARSAIDGGGESGQLFL